MLVQRFLVFFIFAAAVFVSGDPTAATDGQLAAPGTVRVVYGHHHLNVSSIDAHRRFWVDGLGGAPATLTGLPSTIIRFPGTLVFLREQAPKSDMATTVVTQLRFTVKSLAASAKTLKAAGFDLTPPTKGQGIVRGPDGVVVELVESSSAPAAIAHRELQLTAEDPQAMRAWYAQMFGAALAKGGAPVSATIPGTTLVFPKASARPSATQGSVVDHIGFEVAGLEAFCVELQGKGVKFDRPYFKVPKAELGVAFLTDPWGTYIELTEGLNKVQ